MGAIGEFQHQHTGTEGMTTGTKTREGLHALARKCAEGLKNPDRKQLRFNEIVEAAILFYPMELEGGVAELVASCDRTNEQLYVKGQPMWMTLADQYQWLLDEPTN